MFITFGVPGVSSLWQTWGLYRNLLLLWLLAVIKHHINFFLSRCNGSLTARLFSPPIGLNSCVMAMSTTLLSRSQRLVMQDCTSVEQRPRSVWWPPNVPSWSMVSLVVASEFTFGRPWIMQMWYGLQLSFFTWLICLSCEKSLVYNVFYLINLLF